MRTRSVRLMAGLLLLGAAASLGAQAPATDPRGRAADFLARLKSAVDGPNRAALGALMQFPITVYAGPFNIPVRDASALGSIYDSVFTPELHCSIVRSEIPTPSTPKPAHVVSVAPEGVTLADGAIWAPIVAGRPRIARIRVPPAQPSVSGRRGVEHVTFAQPKGERSASYTGWLVRKNVDSFVVSVKRGETLTARIEGFRGHDGTLRAARLPEETGAPRPAADLGRMFSERAAADGEYRIDVAHLAAFCDPPQQYRLSIGLR